MSIEQQVQEAIEDLRGLLVDGVPVEDAIAMVSKERDLKPEVVGNRGVKALGELSTLKAREESRSVPIRQQARIDQAIRDFEAAYRRGEEPHWKCWLESDPELTISDDQRATALERLRSVFHDLVLDEMLRGLEEKTASLGLSENPD